LSAFPKNGCITINDEAGKDRNKTKRPVRSEFHGLVVGLKIIEVEAEGLHPV
jgi:hypothetical protein